MFIDEAPLAPWPCDCNDNMFWPDDEPMRFGPPPGECREWPMGISHEGDECEGGDE